MSKRPRFVQKSRTRTVNGLLRDVIALVRKHPQHADMTIFEDGTVENRPVCGTVGCFAGWVVMLAKGCVDYPAGSMSVAQQILGPKLQYTFKDTQGITLAFFNAGAGDACETTDPGTREHAEAVIERIRRFMALNAKALKGRRLPKGL
jgi:hypothetical protein